MPKWQRVLKKSVAPVRIVIEGVEQGLDFWRGIDDLYPMMNRGWISRGWDELNDALQPNILV